MADLPVGGVTDAVPISQLQLLRQQLQRTPLALTAADLFLAWLLLRAGFPAALFAWVVVNAALQIGRALHIKRITDMQAPPSRRVLRQVYAWFFVLGVMRAVPVVLAFTVTNAELQFLVTLVSVGLAAGGVGSAVGLVRAYAAWALPLGGTLMLAWFSQADFGGRWIAALVAMMFILLTLNVRSYGDALRQLGREVERANAERQRAETERQRADDERQRAESAVQAKTRFFAAASHDLRQPLGVLRWYGDAVRLHARQLGHEALMSIGDGIGRALEYAEPLVRKYLDIAKLEAGALELVPRRIEVAPLFEQAREDFARDLEDSGLQIALVLDERPGVLAVFADQGVLRSIVDNLLGNAIKFTPAGGRVTLAARRAEGGRVVRLSISDTGVGIDPAEHDRVFDDFYQVENPERNRSKGMGLGLAIVRRQAALLGTSVQLFSELGRGTRFEFDLPAADTPVTESAATPSADWPRPPPGTPRVLVVDDEPEIRRALGAMLGAARWHVLGAAGLDEARQVLRDAGHVDVIVVDFRLRGPLTGIDVIHALRADGFDAPAAVITGDTAPEQLRQLASTGLPVLHKPVAGEQLFATLIDLMGREERRHEAR